MKSLCRSNDGATNKHTKLLPFNSYTGVVAVKCSQLFDLNFKIKIKAARDVAVAQMVEVPVVGYNHGGYQASGNEDGGHKNGGNEDGCSNDGGRIEVMRVTATRMESTRMAAMRMAAGWRRCGWWG